MHPSLARRLLRKLMRTVARDPDSFLRHVSGVIHVGANDGEERFLYEKRNLRVIWIEPIPDVFLQLQRNIAELPRQKAYQYLITDKDNDTVPLHVANNAATSSSILDLAFHRDIWPDVSYTHSIDLNTITLASMVDVERIAIAQYDALVLDTQGSELLVLKGALSLLRWFKYIKTEVPDFESYRGCCQLSEMDDFMRSHGFREHVKRVFAWRDGGGKYYDIVYRRIT